MSSDDEGAVLLFLGGVLGFLIGVGVALIMVGNEYRQGVIDAQLGKVRVEMIEREDGTRKWGKVQDTDGGDK